MIKLDTENKKIFKLATESFEKIKTFFHDQKEPDITVHVLLSRKDFDKALGRKTPEWMVGVTKNQDIYIMSPEAFEKESSHPRSYFGKVLMHEITHSFVLKINKNNMQWLDEGLALNLADQKKEKPDQKTINFFIKDKNLYKNLDLDTFSTQGGYRISYFLVKYILSRFPKEIIIKLLKIDSSKNKPWKIEEEIEKIIGEFIKKWPPSVSCCGPRLADSSTSLCRSLCSHSPNHLLGR